MGEAEVGERRVPRRVEGEKKGQVWWREEWVDLWETTSSIRGVSVRNLNPRYQYTGSKLTIYCKFVTDSLYNVHDKVDWTAWCS